MDIAHTHFLCNPKGKIVKYPTSVLHNIINRGQERMRRRLRSGLQEKSQSLAPFPDLSQLFDPEQIHWKKAGSPWGRPCNIIANIKSSDSPRLSAKQTYGHLLGWLYTGERGHSALSRYLNNPISIKEIKFIHSPVVSLANSIKQLRKKWYQFYTNF